MYRLSIVAKKTKKKVKELCYREKKNFGKSD